MRLVWADKLAKSRSNPVRSIYGRHYHCHSHTLINRDSFRHLLPQSARTTDHTDGIRVIFVGRSSIPETKQEIQCTGTR